jgi:hypothetical protein
LPSVTDLALDKAYFKNKKNSLPSARSRALDKSRVHSAGNLLSLSLSLSHHYTPPPPRCPRRRRDPAAPPRPRRACARTGRALAAAARAALSPSPLSPPTPSPHRRSHARRRTPYVVPSPCPRRVPAVRALPVPPPRPHRACPRRALAVPSPCPRRLARDPSVRPRPVVPPVGYD